MCFSFLAVRVTSSMDVVWDPQLEVKGVNGEGLARISSEDWALRILGPGPPSFSDFQHSFY